MNKLLLVAPVVLTAAFVAIERPAAHRRELAAQRHAAALAEADAAAQAKRLAVAAAAKADALRSAAERDQREREKTEARERAYAETLRRIDDRTAALTSTCTTLAAELTTLDRQLADLRTQEETVTRNTFELTKQVEHRRTDRRSAEFELQRTTAMVASRLGER